MKRLIRHRPSPAMVVALLALFVALAGTSYAAVSLPKNSVGARQLKKGAVTPPKVAKTTIALFKGQRGPAGAQGLQGIQGAQGAQGAPGLNGVTGYQIVQADSATNSVDKSVTVACPAGKKAIAGGSHVSGLHGANTAWSAASFPASETEWRAIGIEGVGYAGNWYVRVFAICAVVS